MEIFILLAVFVLGLLSVVAATIAGARSEQKNIARKQTKQPAFWFVNSITCQAIIVCLVAWGL